MKQQQQKKFNLNVHHETDTVHFFFCIDGYWKKKKFNTNKNNRLTSNDVKPSCHLFFWFDLVALRLLLTSNKHYDEFFSFSKKIFETFDSDDGANMIEEREDSIEVYCGRLVYHQSSTLLLFLSLSFFHLPTLKVYRRGQPQLPHHTNNIYSLC